MDAVSMKKVWTKTVAQNYLAVAALVQEML